MTTRVIIVTIEIASHELSFPELDIKQTETTIMTVNAATYWDIRDRRLAFTDRPIIMGILNVTPDSFSDGGKFYSVQSAVDQAKRMEDHGAAILDVGGESTRPYSESVAQEEELRRVTEVLERLQGKVAIPISIDTKKATVASAAIQLGASIINDVSGLEADPAMVDVAKQTGAGVCAMHMQGTPQTMQDNPRYDDVVEDILLYLKQRRQWLINHGIEESKICLDPGIGFGKTHEHNITLLQNASRFHETLQPVLIGHSRKGFIAKLLGSKDVSRTLGTVGVSLSLVLQKIQVLRVHDVMEHKQAIDLFLACNPRMH
jgi:dihydropteroate synthase